MINKYKFLILFAILLIVTPFVVTEISKTFFQEAQSISTSPVCLKNNPPGVWVEKDKNSKVGQAFSGVSNVEILSANLIVCGEVEITGFEYIVGSQKIEDIIKNASFSLYIFGQKFHMKKIIKNGEGKALVSFELEESVKISGSVEKVVLFGFLPDDYSEQASFSLSKVSLKEEIGSETFINKVSSTLSFVKK